MSKEIEKNINEEKRGVSPEYGQRILGKMIENTIPCEDNNDDSGKYTNTTHCHCSPFGISSHEHTVKKKKRHGKISGEEKAYLCLKRTYRKSLGILGEQINHDGDIT
jgi:hypothetical protein